MDSGLASAQWFLLIGALLLLRGLGAPTLARLPVSAALLYLAVGLLIGPTGLNLFHFNPLRQSALLERLTEAAVLISLYAAGVKMPVPVAPARWRTPLLLAFVSMTITVVLVAAFVHFALGLQPGAAVLLGALLAPTDPVLATDVQTRHPGDRDRLRFTLTSEAGINDGSAYPLVLLGLGLLGLHELGVAGWRWVAVDVLWATAAGIAIGIAGGTALAVAAHRLRRGAPAHGLLDDLLGLGLIGVVYGLCVMVGAGGFLAVFFAALALRQAEHRLAARAGGTAPAAAPTFDPPPLSEGSLVFKEHLERLSEVLLILLIGGTLFVDSWSWRAVSLALFVFLVARPVSVLLGLLGSRTRWRLRGLTGWFGVRGIGSLYYLMFAIGHGLPQDLALELIHLTLVVVTLSIVVHGTSVRPLLDRLWRRAGTVGAGRSP